MIPVSAFLRAVTLSYGEELDRRAGDPPCCMPLPPLATTWNRFLSGPPTPTYDENAGIPTD